MYRGRIRIEIKNDDGTPIKPEFATRESVMRHIGESIPKLKTRQNRLIYLFFIINFFRYSYLI